MTAISWQNREYLILFGIVFLVTSVFLSSFFSAVDVQSITSTDIEVISWFWQCNFFIAKWGSEWDSGLRWVLIVLRELVWRIFSWVSRQVTLLRQRLRFFHGRHNFAFHKVRVWSFEMSAADYSLVKTFRINHITNHADVCKFSSVDILNHSYFPKRTIFELQDQDVLRSSDQ